MVKPQLDVSGVPLQGGYIAKQCPVVIQNRMLVPELEVAVPAEVQLRADQGVFFEAEVLPKVRSESSLDWVVINEALPEQAIAQTLAAMNAGSPVIEQAHLPHDQVGRRTGKPDLLVYFEDGYIPVDVKHHRTLDESEEQVITVSNPSSPSPSSSYELGGASLRKNAEDAIQLAHYRRMLEAAGFASTSTVAGIIGKEQVIVWYDLDEPMWTTPAKSDGKKRRVRSSLERYDFEFSFRLDIAATALEAKSDAQVELLVEPMSCSECAVCGFREHCFVALTEGAGDVSLLPRLTYQNWRSLRDLGIYQRDQVADLHYPTASLMKAGVEISTFLELAANAEGSTPVAELRPRAHKQIEVLTSNGIKTAADLNNSVDRLTAAVGGFIADRILDARAALGPDDVYRRPGCKGNLVPRADIEIDIDMENVNEGVYLWGALVSNMVGSASFDTGYQPFFSWDPLDEEKELSIFFKMWSWLSDQRSKASNLGLTLRCYVWHEPAENTQLRRIAKRADEKLEGNVEALIASQEWIDLKGVFAESWLTGGSVGLKAIAPLAGFSWEVDDPGGGLSMVKYVEAVSADADAAVEARQWLLEYNKGDVLATRRIRDWLDAKGSHWPEVATA